MGSREVCIALLHREGVINLDKQIITTLVIAIVTASAGFFGGLNYQKSKTPQFGSNQFRDGAGRPSGFPVRNGNQTGRPINGEIISIEDKTITVKNQDGSSKIIVISDSTKVNISKEGSKDDLSVGSQVIVIGNESSDGTVTAQTINVGGMMTFRNSENQSPAQE